jgi:hypothetical protein
MLNINNQSRNSIIDQAPEPTAEHIIFQSTMGVVPEFLSTMGVVPGGPLHARRARVRK